MKKIKKRHDSFNGFDQIRTKYYFPMFFTSFDSEIGTTPETSVFAQYT